MLYLSDKINLPILLATIIAAAGLIICISQFGIGMSNDSVAYIAAGKSFYLEGRFFLPYRDSYFTDWPPLFSMILSIAYFLKIENKILFYGAQIVIVYSMVVYIFGYLALKLTSSSIWAIIAIFFFVTAPPTFFTFSYLWSETYFIFFTLIFLINLSRYLSSGRFCFLLACSMAAGLSVMIRYAGIVNIITGIILILLFTDIRFVGRLKRMLLFCIISSIMLLVWFLRNYNISSTLTGAGRTVEITHFKYTLVTLAKALWNWFLPFPAVPLAGLAAIIFLGLVLSGLVYYIFLSIRDNRKQGLLLLTLGCYSSLYLILIFAASLFQSSDFPDYRLTSPAFFSYLLILVSFINNNLFKTKKYANSLIVIVIISIGIHNLYRYCFYLNQSIEKGIDGISDKSSANSHLINSIHKIDWAYDCFEPHQVFSNVPEELYYYGFEGIQRIHKGFRNELSDNFKTKSNLKVIVWMGDKAMLYDLLEHTAKDYTVVSSKMYNDGILMFLRLNKKPLCINAEWL